MAFGCGHRGFNRSGTATDATTQDDADGDVAIGTCLTSPELLAYWPMDETTGAVVRDMSRNQIAADLAGDTAWTMGHVGGALQFNKVGSGTARLRSTSSLSFGGGAGSFTLSYWLWLTTMPATNAPRTFELAYCTGQSYIYARVQSDLSAGLAGYDALNNYARTESLPNAMQLNRWTHVVHVVDRTARVGQTYIDGVVSGGPDDLSPWVDVIDCSQAVDTANFGGWLSYFDGRIDDMRIYGRALTASEVSELAQITATGCQW